MDPAIEGDDRAALLAALDDIDALVAVVADDVAEPPHAVRPAVDQAVRWLRRGADRQRARAEMVSAGIAAARAGVPRATMLDRYLTIGWAVWEAVVAQARTDRDGLARLGSRLLRGVDMVAAALAEGYATVDREHIERDAHTRLGFLQEILETSDADLVERARRRRLANRYGLEPDGSFRIIGLAVGDRTEASDTEEGLTRLLALVRPVASSQRRRPGLTLPQVLDWRGRLLIVARPAWPGLGRLRDALPALVDQPWTVVVGEPVEGIDALPGARVRVIDALRAAELLGHRGWQDRPAALAIEELLVSDPSLTSAAVEHELGPILADGRMGEALLETLEAYLTCGSNMREVARRLHLAHRTVAYRLRRIESLLGHPIDGEAQGRLVIALMGWRAAQVRDERTGQP